MPRAVGLTDEILSRWSPIIEDLQLVPGSGGAFELSVDGELVFSKKQLKRHAEPGEIVELLRPLLGEELMDR